MRAGNRTRFNPEGSTGQMRLHVKERHGARFLGEITLLNDGRRYDCQGEVSMGEIRFTVKAGNFEQTYTGTYTSKVMHLTYEGTGQKGEFRRGTAHLTKEE